MQIVKTIIARPLAKSIFGRFIKVYVTDNGLFFVDSPQFPDLIQVYEGTHFEYIEDGI